MVLNFRQYLDQQTQHLVGPSLWYALQNSKRFIYYYILGIMVAIHFIGASKAMRGAFAGVRTRQIIAVAANCTFALYLFHSPIIDLINYAGLDGSGTVMGAVLIAAILGIVLLLTYWTDRAKNIMRSAFTRALQLIPASMT